MSLSRHRKNLIKIRKPKKNTNRTRLQLCLVEVRQGKQVILSERDLPTGFMPGDTLTITYSYSLRGLLSA